jgi:large subunit ribosomal protein L3
MAGQFRGLKRPPDNQSQLKEGRRSGALAMKVGMMSVLDRWGKKFGCTILQLDECRVVQVKTEETNGYNGLQLGVGEAKLKRVGISKLGHYKKAGIVPSRKLWEFRVTPDCIIPVGTHVRAQHFIPGQLVDVCGISKGKGFQGAMKLWNFKGGRASHGNSLSHRVLGSTGQRQDPGRVFKGKKMPGRMGTDRITVQNLKIIKIDPSRELLYVYGAVPGNKGVFVRITDAMKGPFFPSPPPMPTYVYEPSGPDAVEDLSEIFYPTKDTDEGIPTDHPNPMQL